MTEKINEIKVSRKASNYLVCSFTRKNRVPISLKKKKKKHPTNKVCFIVEYIARRSAASWNSFKIRQNI